MRIHEAVNCPLHVQKTLSAFVASKIAHRLYSVFDVAVVALYRIVVVLQPVFPARDRNAEHKIACSVEKFVERAAIILEGAIEGF